jgi:hypothetical protein
MIIPPGAQNIHPLCGVFFTTVTLFPGGDCVTRSEFFDGTSSAESRDR